MNLFRRIRDLERKPLDHPLGYLVAVSGALMQLMNYGIDNTFSIFSPDMQKDASLGYPSQTEVSFGNSVSLGLSPVFGLFAGFLVDRVPPRYMMLTSTTLLFLGLWIASSAAHSVLAVALTYSLLASIASAAMISPGAAATGSWFRKHLGLAQGITFCGGGVGSLIVPSAAGKWLENYGWRTTFRLMSSFCAIGLVAALFSCRRREPRTVDDAELTTEVHGESSLNNANGNREKLLISTAPDANDPNDRSTDEAINGGCEKVTDTSLSQEVVHEKATYANIIEIAHTRRLTVSEYLLLFLRKEFLANFFMFLIFGWAFYGLIYMMPVYLYSMGAAGSAYSDAKPIPEAKVATIFTFYGGFQAAGSIGMGAFASFSTAELSYVVCCVVAGVSSGLFALCRSYGAFAASVAVTGFCTAGIFSTMSALIVKNFYGPNLGFITSCVFLAGCVGGFSSPPMQAQLQVRNNGSCTYGCIVIACCTVAPGILCLLFLWEAPMMYLKAKWHNSSESVELRETLQ